MPSVILLKAPDRSIITGIRTSTMKHASLLLTSSLLLCGFGNMAEAMAQRYTIKVHTFQKFEHALGESISSAMDKGLFAYKEGYRTRTTYIFDLDRRTMRVYAAKRPMVEHPIVHIFSTGEFFVVELGTNSGNAICKFYRDDDERPLFTMEYHEGDRMAGFFTGKIRWKREEDQVRPLSARAVEQLERQSRFILTEGVVNNTNQ
jgi:hypothetical protein